jgi:hypothetical protein
MWIILGSVCTFIIALYVFQALNQPSQQIIPNLNHKEPTISAKLSTVKETPETLLSATKEKSHAVFDSHASESTAMNSTETLTTSSQPRLKEDDQRLRVFDEL